MSTPYLDAVCTTSAAYAPLAELHIWHAEALGALRDTSGCTAAISEARTQVEQLKLDDDPPWL